MHNGVNNGFIGFSMFIFLFGAALGTFFGFVLFIVLLLGTDKIDTAFITNLVIAAATVSATILHYSTLRQQRKIRVWEINKSILLDLSRALNEVIKASNYYLELEYAKLNGEDEEDLGREPSPTAFRDFEKYRDQVIDVYHVFLDQDFINDLNEAKEIDRNITHAVNHDYMETIVAYEETIEVNNKLKKRLTQFISRMSGLGGM